MATIMPSMPSSHAGFSVIEQYRTLAKHVLDEDHQMPTTCKDMITLDQEVPQMRSLLEEGDFYTADIKTEVTEASQPDLITFMENILDNGKLNASSDLTVSESRIPTIAASVAQPEFQQLFSSSKNNHSNPQFLPQSSSLQYSTISSTLSSTQSSLSSSTSPMLSSTAFTSSTSLSSSSSLNSTLPRTSRIDIHRTTASQGNVKMSSYITELGGSGCVVMTPAQSSTDLLTGEAFTLSTSIPNFLSVPLEENMDYLDLDKQPVSLYEDLKLPGDSLKTEPSSQVDCFPLEEAALMMRDVIHHDCDSLKVPYDPTLWSVDHVRTWVSWVCQKNGLQDVSALTFPLDGKALCALTVEEFPSHYGEAGENICTELELWKAANNCFPESYLPQTAMPVAQQHSNSVSYSRMNVQGTPCVSPAPSSDSSLDSSTAFGSSRHTMDDSDSEEDYSSGDNVPNIRPTKVGRGHKQTIHLWEFLRELLISKENHSDCIRWLDRKAGIFKIEDSKKVASLWGQRKNRPAMNYDKLSRSVRQYYKKKIIKKTETSKRLVYQFCPGYL